MKVHKYPKCEGKEQGPGAFQRTIIGPNDGAKNIVAFMWELEPGVTRPTHSHANEHGGIVLSGTGVLSNGKEKVQLVKDDIFYLASQEPHEISNNGKEIFRYMFFNPVKD